jgi:hypothetical protein
VRADSASQQAIIGLLQRRSGNHSVQPLVARLQRERIGIQRDLLDDAEGAFNTVSGAVGGAVESAEGALDTVTGSVSGAVESAGGVLDTVSGAVGGAVRTAENAAETTLAELAKLGTCGPKLASLALGVSAEVQALLLRHLLARTMPTAGEAEILLPVVEKAIIDGVCACLTDELVAAVALHVYLAGEPLAQDHLRHYLKGGGAPYVENIEDLFARNPTVRANVAVQIAEQYAGGKMNSGVLEGGADLPGGGQVKGFPPITQSDWDDQDWRNAIGNVDKLEWELLSAPDAAGNVQVKITLTDAYAWHAKEERMTQCVHQALEDMKAKGAADYTSTGTGVVTLNLGSTFTDHPDPGAR